MSIGDEGGSQVLDEGGDAIDDESPAGIAVLTTVVTPVSVLTGA